MSEYILILTTSRLSYLNDFTRLHPEQPPALSRRIHDTTKMRALVSYRIRTQPCLDVADMRLFQGGRRPVGVSSVVFTVAPETAHELFPFDAVLYDIPGAR